jgi:hypothetical protein
MEMSRRPRSDGSIAGLVAAAHLGVSDWRDLKVAANARRGSPYLPLGVGHIDAHTSSVVTCASSTVE